MQRYEAGKEYSLGAIQAIQGVTRRTLYNWIEDGILVKQEMCGKVRHVRICLPAYKVGQQWRVMGSAMIAFIHELNNSAA